MLDLNVGYVLPESSVLEGVRVNANVRNLLDREPPVVLTGSNAMDARNHDPFGRAFQFSMTKRF
jgi:iron complex outermembrane receptor protein